MTNRSELEALASAVEETLHRVYEDHADYRITTTMIRDMAEAVARRLQPGNAEAAYRLLQDVRDHCIRVEGMWPDLDTHARLQQMHVELQDRVRSTVAAKGGLQPARVPEGWQSELLVNIKRSCVRGRNSAGLPDTPLASSYVAMCDHIENMADQLLAAAPAPEAERAQGEEVCTEFNVGDKVEWDRFGPPVAKYPATIVAVTRETTYSLRFNDGDIAHGVTASSISISVGGGSRE